MVLKRSEKLKSPFALFLFAFLFTHLAAFGQERSQITIEQLNPAPKEVALTFLKNTSSLGAGELIYGDYVRLNPQGREWANVLKIAKITDAGLDSISVFQVKGARRGERAFDPQFSPDGKQVMFKVGDNSNSYSNYQLCFWDRKTNQIRLGPDHLVFLHTFWSPNSQYVAYIEGGDIEGNSSPKDPLRLSIYDLATGKSRFVAQDTFVKSLTWTPQNTLLYCRKKPDTKDKDHSTRSFDGDIYAIPGEGGEAKQFIPDAYNPVISEDGSKLVFAAWSAEKADARSQIGLYSFNRSTQERTLLKVPFSQERSVNIQWLPDNRRVVVLQQTHFSPEAKVAVFLVDTQTNSFKTVASLEAKDVEAISRVKTQPQVALLDLSRDGKSILVEISQFGAGDDTLYDEELFLRVVNLETGQVSTEAKLKNTYGVDWH